MKSIRPLFLTLLLSTLVFSRSFAADPIFPKPVGIAFLGDSITEAGANRPGGYVNLVVNGLEANGVKVTPFFAGVSGHKSNQMLERLERDVISKKPDWMTLSCGVNDVWHGPNGVPLDQYQKNITAIIDQAQTAGIKVMILTATVIHEDAKNPENQSLAPYNDFLRKLAVEKKCLLADLNTDMWNVIKASKAPTGRLLTSDGVHMNIEGNRLMAEGVLKAFGLNKSQMGKALESISKLPNTAGISGNMSLTLAEYDRLKEFAAKQNTSVEGLLNNTLRQQLEPIFKLKSK